MCDLVCGNLIDLSLEEETVKTDDNAPHESQPLNPSPLDLIQDLHFVPPSSKKRDSLDNNPFDCVQKLANNRQDDPFDIVEKEACFKALHASVPPVEVKVGNLLSLSNENLLEEDAALVENSVNVAPKNFDLESESPPVAMMEKFGLAPGSCSDTDSYTNSSAESSAASKVKKAMEYRKRLLKLSVTNAALNSPASRRSSLEESDTPGTPVSSLLSKQSFYGENLLAAESPLKFVDDDIMSEEPPSLLLDEEKNFEADLEMLKIPMLNEINSPASENSLLALERKLLERLNDTAAPSSTLTDLEAIKAKLQAKRLESNNNHHHDINALISDLKSLINSGCAVDNETKVQASSILETLSSALSSSQARENICSHPTDALTVPPQTIKRQGTFDLELQKEDDDDVSLQPPVKEMPNCMISSTATYDGETPGERLNDLQLPEIDPASPDKEPSSQAAHHSDMNDIMEQLSKLLIHNNTGDMAQNSAQNPTFIVVMNTTPMPQNNKSAAIKDASSTLVSSLLEHSFHDEYSNVSAFNTSSTTTRRRSQSLSIHDKVKVVQLPLKPPTPKRLQKQNSIEVDDSPSVVTTPPPYDLDTPEFKTPSRMVRRNSYSSGTPYTAAVCLKRTGVSTDGKHVRRTQALDTHHEGQQQQKAIVRPLTMPSHSMTAFKPDLKKKQKFNNESIMKSSAPLKATIPVKKVAPMIKTSPSSPNYDSPINDAQNASQHKTQRIPTTPMAPSRSSTLSVGPGFPNACSTPSTLTSPLKRASSGAITKPRYSYMSATPNPKTTSTAVAASGGLKRRTITEFKTRSPLKPRLSTSGIAAAAAAAATASSTSARASAASSRLSTSASAKLPAKAPAKLAPNTAAVRPTGRYGASRLSGVGSSLSARNKENSRP